MSLKFTSSQPFRYLAVGGSAYLFEMACLYGLRNVIGLRPVLAVGISFWLSFVLTFLAQRAFTFTGRDASRSFHAQALGYTGLVLWNYVFTLACTHFLADTFGVFAVRTAVILITTVWNYHMYRYIFRTSTT